MNNKFNEALKIKQTGAVRIGKTKEGDIFSLGGGVFTEKELVKSRERFGKLNGFK